MTDNKPPRPYRYNVCMDTAAWLEKRLEGYEEYIEYLERQLADALRLIDYIRESGEVE